VSVEQDEGGEFEEWRKIGMGVDFILTWTEGGVQQEAGESLDKIRDTKESE